jgi:proteasome lid subunit RPN8/RPN11
MSAFPPPPTCNVCGVSQLRTELGWSGAARAWYCEPCFAELSATDDEHEQPQNDPSSNGNGPSANGNGPADLRFMWATDLRDATPEAPPWVLVDYIARGAVTMVAGKPKAGKSTWAWAVADAVSAKAAKFLGRSVMGGPVVYVSEEGPGTLRDKLPGGPVRVLTRDAAWPKPSWPDLVRAAVSEAQHIRAELLVIDALAFWASFAEGQEKDPGAAQAVMDALLSATSAGLAVLIVHHQRKAGGEDGDAVRGATTIFGSVDVLVEVERLGEDAPPTQRRLVAMGRWPQTTPVLLVDRDPGSAAWRVIGEANGRGEAAGLSARERILRALPQEGDGTTERELAQVLGLDPRKIGNPLRELHGDGLIERIGGGRKGDPYRYHRPPADSPPEPGEHPVQMLPLPVGGSMECRISLLPRGRNERHAARPVPAGAPAHRRGRAGGAQATRRRLRRRRAEGRFSCAREARPQQPSPRARRRMARRPVTNRNANEARQREPAGVGAVVELCSISRKLHPCPAAPLTSIYFCRPTCGTACVPLRNGTSAASPPRSALRSVNTSQRQRDTIEEPMLTRPAPADRQEARGKGYMLIATKSFNAVYDGESVSIVAGRDRVQPGHPIAASHPHYFKSETAPHYPTRKRRPGQKATPKPQPRRTTSMPDVLPRPAWALGPVGGLAIARAEERDPELRDSTSPLTVTLRERVHDQLNAAIRATPAGYETGGLLIGSRGRGDRVRVIEAWGPGPTAERARNHLQLDYHGELAKVREIRAAGHDVVVAGMWHTHPRGAPRPSRGDLAVFGELLDRVSNIVFPTSSFVGLIVSQPERSYPPPLAAWVVRRDGRHDDLICERAELEG